MRIISQIYLEQQNTNTKNNVRYDQIFSKIKSLYKKYYGWNLNHMKLVMSNVSYYNNGKPDPTRKIEEFGGCWTKNSIIYINSDLELARQHYNVKLTLLEFAVILIAHELAHEVFKKILNNKERIEWVNNIKSEKFSSGYMKYVSKDQYDEELFCEYLASKIFGYYF